MTTTFQYFQEWLEIVDHSEDDIHARAIKLDEHPEILFEKDLRHSIDLSHRYPEADSPDKGFEDYEDLKADDIPLDDDAEDFEPDLMQGYM